MEPASGTETGVGTGIPSLSLSGIPTVRTRLIIQIWNIFNYDDAAPAPFPLCLQLLMRANIRAACHTSHTHTHMHVRKPEKLLNCFIKCTNSQLIVSVKKRGREREKRRPKWSHFEDSLQSALCSLQPASCSCNFSYSLSLVFVSISISISSRSLASGYMLMPTRICIIYAWAYWQLLL